MISINNALNIIINESPFLEDGLYNEYINLTSLANYIKPQIESLTKKEVTIWAIKMALSRYIKEKTKTIKYKKFNIENLFIKKNINIIYLKNKHEKFDWINNIKLSDDDYLTTIQWNKNATIIYNDNLKKEIEKILPKEDIEMKIENLSLVWVFLEKNFVNEIWVIYTLTKKINFNNINIIEIISNYTEVNLIIKNEDLRKTLDALMM